ncbi:Lrp/AsnC family transcriptional regulator [uncultured Serinicoccus sp.]|uniref:Lrp/AsnC family transcriptional regulator n=1 Tax=uncultured Serinicoccus sp. TaxID=735514 RepID=UPI00262B0070|nr:Lrp/AsnC family transcriptional regulator [uncultured Serinicoccus sp.]
MRNHQAPGLDQLDRRIIAALQIHGRATWQQIAGATGSSDSTVARRAQRLFGEGLAQVVATTDPLLCVEGYPVLVEITTTAGSVTQVAKALAGRTDVRFAALLTGSFDLVVELIVSSQAELARVLLTEIDRIPGVWATKTESVLSHYKLEHTWLQTDLPAEAADILVQHRGAVTPGDPRPLDERERALVDLLSVDARASISELAQQLGASETSVRRRLDNLLTEGRVRLSTLVDPELLGYSAPAMYWLHMDLRHVDDAAKTLTRCPEVRYVAATSGHSNITLEVVLRDQADLHRFNTEVLAGLPGLHRAEAGQQLATLRRAFVLNRRTLALIDTAEEETHA